MDFDKMTELQHITLLLYREYCKTENYQLGDMIDALWFGFQKKILTRYEASECLRLHTNDFRAIVCLNNM